MKILNVDTDKRRLGSLGEAAAAKYLKRHGYLILERNYVARGNEIDIIAYKNRTLAFIEVKTRSVKIPSPYESRPAASVTPAKQQKIINAARHYKLHDPSDYRMRFDIIEVLVSEDGEKEKFAIKHLENAFDANTAYSKHFF